MSRLRLCPGPRNRHSRESLKVDSIRRRRECEKCNRRFTTYERIDEFLYMVAKKDGRREKFERTKALDGLLAACARSVRFPRGRWSSWSMKSRPS